MRFLQAVVAVVVGSLAVGPLLAQDAGSAGGKGIIKRVAPSGTDTVAFAPRYAFAYAERTGPKTFTWIVLTEKQPPLGAWSAAKDRAEARRTWCEKEKTPFVAVKLDSDWKVDLYFLCPANGSVNIEMLNTMNGLESVVVKFDARDDKRLKGTLRTGQGSCPGPPDGTGQAYCEPTGDYTFDAPMTK